MKDRQNRLKRQYLPDGLCSLLGFDVTVTEVPRTTEALGFFVRTILFVFALLERMFLFSG